MRNQKSIPCPNKFAIVVDGKCESWYLNMLKRNEKIKDINIEPKLPQKKKLCEQFEKVKEFSRIYDKVIWVIDLDVINKETKETKKGNSTAIQELKKYFKKIDKLYTNVITIINNPCLEYWYLLHFEQTSKYYNNCGKVVKQIKKQERLTDYEKTEKYYTRQNSDIYLRLKPFLTDAITNANLLDNFDFNNPCVGLSQMQKLFQLISIP